MKEILFTGILIVLILLGFYSMDRVDCFLEEHYRMQWEKEGEENAPLCQSRTHTIGLPSLFHYGTIFLQKHTIKHYRW